MERQLVEIPDSKITGTKSSWRPVTSFVSQGSILILTLFNTVTNDLDDDGIKYAATKITEDTKLGGVVDGTICLYCYPEDLLMGMRKGR